jgi:catechol 2,3-dioxygenase-like lactoylglutathione lyase family enzyme
MGSVEAMTANSFDHVALWVADRHALASFLIDHMGVHEIERTDRFTLVGADARLGKLTLFDAEGPREAGVLERVVLAVSDLDAAVAALPDDLAVERHGDDLVTFDGPEGLGLGLQRTDAPQVQYDLAHVVLRVPDPAAAAEQLATLGFDRDGDWLFVAEKGVLLREGEAGAGERPLLNHLALLVDSAQAVNDEAEKRGLEVADFVDAENTVAVFVWGPDGIKLEYVEHKPSFSLV